MGQRGTEQSHYVGVVGGHEGVQELVWALEREGPGEF